MNDIAQKVEAMKKHLITLGVYGKLQDAFLRAFTAYSKAQ